MYALAPSVAPRTVYLWRLNSSMRSARLPLQALSESERAALFIYPLLNKAGLHMDKKAEAKEKASRAPAFIDSLTKLPNLVQLVCEVGRLRP